MMKVNITTGNIATFPADVIVNAANGGLWFGSGVCGAIFSEADAVKLSVECKEVLDALGRKLRDGEFAITSSAGIPTSKYIAHAVGPVFPSVPEQQEEARKTLAKCYSGVLDWAYNFEEDELLYSVAFPVIGAGVFGWKFEDALKIAISAIESAWSETDAVFEATIVVWDGK